MPSRLTFRSKSNWRNLALCAILLLAGASLVNSQETVSADQTPGSDRSQTAQEAVERLTEPVNIHTPEWSQLPEPEFTTLLVEAINTGRYAGANNTERQAKELAFRRMRHHPELIYPIFIKTLREAQLPPSRILGVRGLTEEYQEKALTDIRAIIDKGLLMAETEQTLHTAFFGTVREKNNPWATFARERFKNESVPLTVRIAAGAFWYSCEDPDLVLEDVRTADAASREASIGALARFIRWFQGNSVLGSNENLLTARRLISEGLKSEASEVRKWAAYASFYVTFQFGYKPIVTNVGAPDEAMIERIEKARDAEKDPEIREIFEEVLDGIAQVPKGD